MSVVSSSASEAEVSAEQARGELVGTLAQLRENLKPENVADEVMTNARESLAVVSDQVWTMARKNPVPAVLIGAGVAMMLGIGGQRTLASRRRGSEPSDLGRGDRITAAMDQDFSDRTSSGPNRRTGADMSNRRRGKATQPKSTLSRLIDEQPMVLAAVGVAVGAALGAAIRQTDTENSLMGRASASVRDAAQEAAQAQYGQIKAAAQHAVEDIKQTAADHGVTADNLQGLVQDVGDKARSAASDATRQIGPTDH